MGDRPGGEGAPAAGRPAPVHRHHQAGQPAVGVGLRLSRSRSLYEEFYDAFMHAPVPPELLGEANDEKREIYFEELRKKIRILLEKSLRWHEQNLLMIERLGVQNEWRDKSKLAYAKLQKLLDPSAKVEFADPSGRAAGGRAGAAAPPAARAARRRPTGRREPRRPPGVRAPDQRPSPDPPATGPDPRRSSDSPRHARRPQGDRRARPRPSRLPGAPSARQESGQGSLLPRGLTRGCDRTIRSRSARAGGYLCRRAQDARTHQDHRTSIRNRDSRCWRSSMVEQLICNQQVAGSSPIASSGPTETSKQYGKTGRRMESSEGAGVTVLRRGSRVAKGNRL